MNHFQRQGRQRGAILVTSLLLLLILTVLGIAMMRMTNLQERMAGNTRDMNVALQAAEAGLRDGERRIAAQVGLPAIQSFTLAPDCLFCTDLPVDIDNPSSFNWAANAIEFGVAGVRDFNQEGAPAEDPRFKIEHTAYVSDDLLQGQDPPTGRDIFTVSARSTGASGNANTVLQSTYARRF